MRNIELASKASLKVLKGGTELFPSELDGSIKSFTPGEWVQFIDTKNKYYYVGYINPFALAGPVARIVSRSKSLLAESVSEFDYGRDMVVKRLESAFSYRSHFKGLKSGSRLLYGNADKLPGLIIDQYMNCTICQINTAGIDRYRDVIKSTYEKHFKQDFFFLDNIEYRKNEILPVSDSLDIPPVVEVEENGIKYELTSDVIQKIGYYYDHRDNRARLLNKIGELDIDLKTGVDLFCYAGSWGLHLLKAGVSHVDFVDQGKLEDVVTNNAKINGYSSEQFNFTRGDVFKYLDQCSSENVKYDIVVSDPPAFKKSDTNKNKAIGGYLKLHQKVMKVLEDKALFVAASCTQNISFNDIDKTVFEAATNSGREVRLLDMGVQGADHPFASLASKTHYIKYIIYYVNKIELE